MGSGNIDEQNLEDVAEDPESGDSETATEVEVSEKALKFKISTECSVGTGRKSYPGSRKGSRERGQHLSSSELSRMMQKSKLRGAGFSFDQNCLSTNKKLSFDTPEFLDEYALTLKKKMEYGGGDVSDVDEENLNKDRDCVLSKETLNLNKRNSEHSVKLPANFEEKKSILKCNNDNKNYTNVEKLKMNNLENNLSDEEIIPSPNKRNSIKNSFVIEQSSVSSSKPSDSVNSIFIEKDDLYRATPIGCEMSKNSRSILSRFRQFTDRFGLSTDKEAKLKTSKLNSVRNNNCTKTLSNSSKTKKNKFVETSCCKSLDDMDQRRASTLPKIKNNTNKKSWKFLMLGKEKVGWSSDMTITNTDMDNQSLPSTSQVQSNCTSPKTSNNTTTHSTPNRKLNEFNNDQINIEFVTTDCKILDNSQYDKKDDNMDSSDAVPSDTNTNLI